MNETGASSLRAKRSVFTGLPSTSSVDVLLAEVAHGKPLEVGHDERHENVADGDRSS